MSNNPYIMPLAARADTDLDWGAGQQLIPCLNITQETADQLNLRRPGDVRANIHLTLIDLRDAFENHAMLDTLYFGEWEIFIFLNWSQEDRLLLERLRDLNNFFPEVLEAVGFDWPRTLSPSTATIQKNYLIEHLRREHGYVDEETDPDPETARSGAPGTFGIVRLTHPIWDLAGLVAMHDQDHGDYPNTGTPRRGWAHRHKPQHSAIEAGRAAYARRDAT